jgi:hypothetical protein
MLRPYALLCSLANIKEGRRAVVGVKRTSLPHRSFVERCSARLGYKFAMCSILNRRYSCNERTLNSTAPGEATYLGGIVMSKVVTVAATALFACILCATPLSLRLSPEGNVALSEDSASARVGRPLTATSVAGVNRRVHRRAYRHGYYGTGAYAYGPYNRGYYRY